MKTGFVTTTRMSHATPGALYSKTTSRFWECENDIRDDIADGNISQDDYDEYKVHTYVYQYMLVIMMSLIMIMMILIIMLTLSPA